MVFGWVLIILGSISLISGIAIIMQCDNTPINNALVANRKTKENIVGVLTPKNAEEEKGRLFEEYIVGLLPKNNSVKLEEWQGDKFCNGVYPVSNRNPDLLLTIRLKGGGIAHVAIECKWRQSFINNTLEWTTKEKIEIYKQYGIEHNASVFVALGVGGSPSNPQELFFIPLSHMNESVIVYANIIGFKSEHTQGRLFYKDYTNSLTVLPAK